ncbi:hypothetical protein [Mycolicibacterium sp. XJ870]
MRNSWIAAAMLAAAATLAACSSGDTQPAPSPETTPEHGSYAYCLTEHGVPAVPGPMAGAPAGVDAEKWRQAMQACSTLAPGPGPGPAAPAG